MQLLQPRLGHVQQHRRQIRATKGLLTFMISTIALGRQPQAERANHDNTDLRRLLAKLAGYRQTDRRRASSELAITAVPFAALWIAMWFSLGVSYWLTLLLTAPTAGFLIRLFVIQHDCGHGSFFCSRGANDRLGRAIGVLTLTPYAHWRHQHALHHGTSGNLDRRGEGDLETLTVREYRSLTYWRQAVYRLFRHPIVLLGIGPLFVFGVRQRLPENPMTASCGHGVR